jgi:beta-lactamase regulating signal transducer with metallopeptidase domain
MIWWANAVQAVSTVVTLVFVIGAALIIVRSFMLRRRCFGARVLQDGPARVALDRLLQQNRIRRPILLLASSRYFEPFTFGFIRWTIVLPEDTDRRLAADELGALLAHEVAHLVRGDAYWLWIGQFLCTCLPFQPLNALARRGWQQAAEYLCDDWAIDRGIRSLSLARCLTQIAEWRRGMRRSPLGLAAGGAKSTLVQRIERLIEHSQCSDDWTKPTRRRLFNLAAVMCSVVLFGFAPRVALPSAAESRAEVRSEVDGSTTGDSSQDPLPEEAWETLHQELLDLEMDLERATDLVKRFPHRTDAESLIVDIRQRASWLRDRHERISLSLGKESD